MTRWLAAYAGLAKPYRFERTLAFLYALLLALVVGGVALHLGLDDRLTGDTPRGWYFLYLAGLIALGLLLAPWPRLAAIALSLAALEVGIGFGSAVLYKLDLAPATLFPSNFNFDERFAWHPLLQAVPAPSMPAKAAKVDILHNSQGMRGRERSAASLQDKTVVAIFGGSTTYDLGSSEGETWGDRLQSMLGDDRFAVINHGVPGYSTVELVLQTAFYQSRQGIAPRCAIYYIGWNDLKNSHVKGLDPGYAHFHLRAQIDILQVRPLDGPYLSISPTLTFLRRMLVLAIDTARPPTWPREPPNAAPDLALEELYARNIRTISAINRHRDIRTVWVGQIMNLDQLTADRPSGLMPLLRDKDVWPLMERMNAIVRREAQALGDVHADIPVDAFEADDFFDQGHFVPTGSRKFAALLAPAASVACR